MKQRIKAMVMIVVFSLGLISQPVPKASAAKAETAKVYYVETQEDEYIAVQKILSNREEKATIRYLASKEEDFEYAACDISDYLRTLDKSYKNNSIYTIGYWINTDWNDSYIVARGQKWYNVDYTYNYNNSHISIERIKLNSEIAKMIRDSGIATASDYDRAAWAYDWICDNVTYDRSYIRHTEFEAFEGSSVCDGYARLFSSFADELGLNCRYVTGMAGGSDIATADWGLHAWNMVELDGTWYQLDSTWDAPSGRKYFLKGTNIFDATHKLSNAILDENFNIASSACTGSSQKSRVPARVYELNIEDISMERLNIGEKYNWLRNNPNNISLTFSSSDSSVASIDSSGVIEAVKVGTTTVKAVNTDLGILQTCEITVSKEKALIDDSTVIMSAKDLVLTYGKTAQLDLNLSESNGQLKDVKYSSADKKIATVDKNGKVKGVRVGTTKITVSYTGGEDVTVQVTIKQVIKTKTATVNKGNKVSLQDAVKISKNGYKDLTFKTSNKKIAAVSSTGYVTGKAGGKCKINIYDKKTNKKVATINVTVTAYETININDL